VSGGTRSEAGHPRRCVAGSGDQLKPLIGGVVAGVCVPRTEGVVDLRAG